MRHWTSECYLTLREYRFFFLMCDNGIMFVFKIQPLSVRHCEIFTTEIRGCLEFASKYYEGGGMHRKVDKPRLSMN